jgi:hypothetical protein
MKHLLTHRNGFEVTTARLNHPKVFVDLDIVVYEDWGNAKEKLRGQRVVPGFTPANI